MLLKILASTFYIIRFSGNPLQGDNYYLVEWYCAIISYIITALRTVLRRIIKQEVQKKMNLYMRLSVLQVE